MKKISLISIIWFHIVIYLLIHLSFILALLNIFNIYKTHKSLYILALFILSSIVGLWIVFNNRCFITVKFNEIININSNYGFRTPIMVFNNNQATLLKDNLKNKIQDYSINGIFIILLVFIIINKRWK